jgi:hypothetical protein
MHSPDLVEDLYRSEEILNKIRTDKRYAQNLYAAFCNMRWQKLEVLPILKDDLWSCTWRSAGGIVAELRGGNEDYMDWYCSGMGGFAALDDETNEEAKEKFDRKGYAPEGTVTEEIQNDLNKLGWVPVPWPKDDN